MKIAAIGHEDDVSLFRICGIESFPVNSHDDALEKLKSLVQSQKYAIIYITEYFMVEIPEKDKKKFQKHSLPAITPIPSPRQNKSFTLNELSKLTKQAIGIKL